MLNKFYTQIYRVSIFYVYYSKSPTDYSVELFNLSYGSNYLDSFIAACAAMGYTQKSEKQFVHHGSHGPHIDAAVFSGSLIRPKPRWGDLPLIFLSDRFQYVRP